MSDKLTDSDALYSFCEKQRFSGFVTAINFEENEFEVRLSDIDHPSRPDQHAIFSLDEIESTEARLLNEGDTVEWYIGTCKTGSTGKQSLSKITVRRFSNWTQTDIENAKQKAEELSDFFNKTPKTSC